jgi:protein SCO1
MEDKKAYFMVAPLKASVAGRVPPPLTEISVTHYGAQYYGNMMLRTHEDKPVRFYDDLIKDKTCIINFMYADCEGVCEPATNNLLKVQELLKSRIGHDIFIYSISLKPEQDTPSKLRDYMEIYGIKQPGWIFLTGRQYDIDTVRSRLLQSANPGLDSDINRITGQLIAINDYLSRWSMVPSTQKPARIVRSVSWVSPTRPSSVMVEQNREEQAILGPARR